MVIAKFEKFCEGGLTDYLSYVAMYVRLGTFSSITRDYYGVRLPCSVIA